MALLASGCVGRTQSHTLCARYARETLKPKKDETLGISRKQCDELIARVRNKRLSDEDREILVKVIGQFAWLIFALKRTFRSASETFA